MAYQYTPDIPWTPEGYGFPLGPTYPGQGYWNLPWKPSGTPPPKDRPGAAGTAPVQTGGLPDWWQEGWNPAWYFRPGGDGQPAGPTPWGGEIPGQMLPWETWAETPFAQVPAGRGREAQQWLNVLMPWMQAQVQQEQWAGEFDWRKAQDVWSRAFQEEQFGWQKGTDVWGRGFQEQQLAQQQQLEMARQAVEREAASMAAWGRHRPGVSRWA